MSTSMKNGEHGQNQERKGLFGTSSKEWKRSEN